MKILILFILISFGSSSKTMAQSLYLGLDWKMAASVSANDYTNGASTADPGLTLGLSFGLISAELLYTKYTLENEVDNNLGTTSLLITDTLYGVGVKLSHALIFYSRFGVQYHTVETQAVNSQNRILTFPSDGSTFGIYAGGGIEFPIGTRFAFLSSANLETVNSDILLMSFYVGLKATFFSF
jgi:hypothetical protein